MRDSVADAGAPARAYPVRVSAKKSRKRSPSSKGRPPARKGGSGSGSGSASGGRAARPAPARAAAAARPSPHAATTPKRSNPTQQPHRDARAARRSAAAIWIEGARLRTLPLALVPVLLGTAEAKAISGPEEWHWVRALACLAVALCLQIGVNYANDYSDGIRGTDDFRVGPPRLTGSGAARPETVKRVAFAFFAVAALAGLFLVWRSEQWWLLAVGAAAILAAWFYTGGKRPYGYAGLGEVFVFLFFGLVATMGTIFVQTLEWPTDGWMLAIAAGLFSCAVLMVNNIRDIEQDRRAGKRTLAVLIGDRAARIAFAVMALAPFAILVMFTLTYRLAIFAFFALLLVIPAVVIALLADRPKDLILALKLTSLGALAYAVLLGLALVLG